MNEFDRLKLAECIVDLLADRDEKRSVDWVLIQARKRGHQHGMNQDKYLLAWEQELLSSNPNPEEWEND